MPAAIDWVRPSFYLAGAAMLALVAGFSLNLGWAGLFWPWPHGRLSFLFVGSILAALGAGSIYIAASQNWRAARPAARSRC